MKILEINLAHICTGPMNYEITWECAACGRLNLLKKRATLLPDEVVACDKCAQKFCYEFDANKFGFPLTDENIIRLEDTILANRNGATGHEIFTLGQDLIFSVNAYIAQLLRNATVAD